MAMDLLNKKGEKVYDSITVYVPGEKPRKFEAKNVVEFGPGYFTAKTDDGGLVMYWNAPTVLERLSTNKTEWDLPE